jgi:hypothetical protein
MAINPVHFKRKNVDITLTPPAAPQAVGLALVNNVPLPDNAFVDDAIALGSIGASASKEFKLDKVTFGVGGSAFAGFGVYRSGAKLLAALKAEGLDDPVVDDTLFPDDKTKNLYALRWGYGVEGSVSASGAVALGVGVSFGASGKGERLYALVRSIDRGAKSLEAIEDAVNSWKAPREVSTPDDLDPGTWLIVETEGSFKANLGLEYGYNYNWARNDLSVGGLNGDLGFKLDLGVQAKLGFSASGRYATVVSRDSDRKEIRLRVYRMKQRGWSFAFDAAVDAQIKQNIIPNNFEDFVKGVFNVNGQQVLKDIVDTFDKWTNPNNNLKDLLSAELVDYAFGLVKDVTGVDPAAKIDDAIKILKDLAERWRGLPHEVTSVVYGFLRDKLPIDELLEFLKRVKAEADPKKLADAIEEKIREAKFFETAVGKWLIAAAETAVGKQLVAAADKGLTTLLANIADSEVFKRFQDIVDKTIGLLDGSEAAKALKKLQEEIEERLGLDKILAVVDEASFASLDKWLKKRLADFLGEKFDKLVFARVKTIVDAVNKLRDDNVAKRFYEKGLKALTDKYTAEFHYSYQKTTTKTALIDVTFDFDADAASAGKQLKKALQGDFGEFLSAQVSGVKLNKGVLTHGMNRRSHIEVNLPFFKSVTDHITESLGRGEAVDTADGRLWVFNLEATDTVSKRHALSRLAVTLQFSRKPGLRQFSGEEFTYNSTLRMTRRAARTKFVDDKLGLLAREYLASEFNAPDKPHFPEYLTALDKALDDKGVAGDNNLGNLLMGFDVSLPSKAFAAWKKAPLDKNDVVYVMLSRRIQELLRRLVPLCYVDDNRKYKETASMYPLLVYSALPPINRVKFNPLTSKLTRDSQTPYEWEVRVKETRLALLLSNTPPTVADNLLKVVLPNTREEMGDISEKSSYTDNMIDSMINVAGKSGSNPDAVTPFRALVEAERDTVKAICGAAVKFREAVEAKDLEKAVADLDEFGFKLVETFNSKLGGIYGTTSSRALGALLFAEATTFFDMNVAKTKPTAMLELISLKETAQFDLDTYLTGERPEGPDVALEQRVISTGD